MRVSSRLLSVSQGRICLGIETSCDDTGVAIVTRDAVTGHGRVRTTTTTTTTTTKKRVCSFCFFLFFLFRLKVLAHRLQSQWDLVARFGGVFPDQAKRAHAAVLDTLVAEALREAAVSPHRLDCVAVTLGPGLAPCLAVGARVADEFARQHRLPVVGVNHMVAHALTPLIDGQGPTKAPFVALLLSGGHSTIVQCRGNDNPEQCTDASQYRVLGRCLVF